MTTSNTEPCRHCGTLTAQRAAGIPYCSMTCIDQRRRERDGTVLECPLPDCDWQTVYQPDNDIARTVAHQNADDHRATHRTDDDST